MAIIAVPQLADNFAYLIVDEATRECGVVDCSEAAKVLAEVKRQKVNLTTALSTHWHFDHVGGNNDLLAAIPKLRIYGARAENGRIPGLTNPIDDGDEVTVGNLHGRAIGIPAHTSGHVAYYFPSLKAVFSGDTLFIAGCGRLFEGGAATMVQSLSKLTALPDDTQVYCGHEYTVKNLAFALTLEPGNRALAAKHQWAERTRREGKWTVPSTIGEEKQINPFLRTDSPEIRASIARIAPGLDDKVAIFAKIRELKDHY
ncbi:MAG TPA: hydroxyacylglutathione hydrolase [Candidatus Binataceae bacterium]|jgi:hydroxyacylglutathione hydrolase|nr:hydroxyacylglutathione hydrolase [Candidatus Binataceae bacterium]